MTEQTNVAMQEERKSRPGPKDFFVLFLAAGAGAAAVFVDVAAAAAAAPVVEALLRPSLLSFATFSRKDPIISLVYSMTAKLSAPCGMLKSICAPAPLMSRCLFFALRSASMRTGSPDGSRKGRPPDPTTRERPDCKIVFAAFAG
jgi:hypothetical protein